MANAPLLGYLQTRFDKVPKRFKTEIRKATDTVALQSWIAIAATCQSLEEFEKAITRPVQPISPAPETPKSDTILGENSEMSSVDFNDPIDKSNQKE